MILWLKIKNMLCVFMEIFEISDISTRKLKKFVCCLDKCKLKKRGEIKQLAAVGCGGGIKMECTGGCLKIHQTLYNCEERPHEVRGQSFPYQLKMVSSLCNYKEKCTVQATREMFGNDECSGAPDSDMALWISYSCDGGQDHTRITGPKRCKKEGEEGKGFYKLLMLWVDEIVKQTGAVLGSTFKLRSGLILEKYSLT